MGKILTTFFILTILLTACTSMSTEKDLSHDGAKTESQDILCFEEEQRLELDEIAAVQGVMDHLFIYTQADAENDTQNFFRMIL